MFQLISTAILSFIGTNIDDLFIVMFLYARATEKKEKIQILLGRYLGLGGILAISLLAALGLSFVPEEFLGLLGVVPIGLGIREWFVSGRSEKNGSKPEMRRKSTILTAALLTLSNGADNVGVYVPLLSGFNGWKILGFLVIFLILTALFCLFGERLANLPLVRKFIERYKGIAVPVIFVSLGIYILLKSYL